MNKYIVKKIYTSAYDDHYFDDCTAICNFGNFPTYESAKEFADRCLGKFAYFLLNMLREGGR